MCTSMQEYAGLGLLTTAEAATYLRIKERKLYELVAEGALPCTKATGKWLFPKAELDRWIMSAMTRPVGFAPADPPPIVGGSHDPLLQWALADSRAGLALLPEGSEAGYRRMLLGEVVAAAIHFHDLDDPRVDANIVVASTEPKLYDAVLIAFAAREQGFLVTAGNPLRLGSLSDAKAAGARLAQRPDGAGAQQLLLAMLAREGLSLGDFETSLIAPTGPDIAQAIRAGHADFGVATRAVARAAGIDFIPVTVERFDLLMRQRDSYRPALQRLLTFIRSEAFAVRARELGGLDVAGSGQVRWAP